ncbi:hypothetical protein E0Z10_g384 [Xylaria hypoxylon]|uniref:C2H2-type domain-containing protein n=1 Tax=Xylaria hypoxylon TaxID=37992 RepID=A0A4Z0YWI5_9PEZI|nr:hypothetical protein E0Z10_g384 [Xylaria hypoxylon]
MAGHIDQSLFDKALGEFKEGLGRREIEGFRATTLKDLKTSIGKLQAKQHAQRRLQDLTRLQPFLGAIEQYEQLVDLFYSNNDIVAFVWGPVKFLLQATSVDDGAFCELLDAYKNMGDNLPLLMQYQDLFYAAPHMIRVLSLMYADILKFQRIILRYFQQPRQSHILLLYYSQTVSKRYSTEWQQVFSESWDTCRSRFSGIILNMARHRTLIETKATPSQIEDVRQSIPKSRQIEDNQLDEQDLQRIRDVHNWLRATNNDIDQENHFKTRAEYPETGRWLLEIPFFKEWFNPQYPTIPPLLWLNGIPGAGKSILASLIVEEARKLNPAPTVLFFYCKHGNSERDNFVALGRSLLAQFLKQDNGLLPSFYQKSCRSGESSLISPALIEELLTLAFGNCKSAYIILDGLDECPRDQRKYITHWFRRLVEDLPNTEPERLRCLLVSQDDGFARKDFAGLAKANKLKQNCPLLTEEKANMIGSAVANVAEGMCSNVPQFVLFTYVANETQGLFLLAKLIWINLSGHTSIARLEEELEPGVFPKEINDAPLKWHEIQVMNSINLDKQCVALERQSFMKSPKDLCASLVDTRSDGTVEFVHLTAKFFLVEEHHVNASAEGLKLATLCIDYLNLPAYICPPTDQQVLDGDYGFMDYAVIYWLRHLEAGVTLKTDKDEQLVEQLAESLGIFISQHWTSPSTTMALAKRHSDKLQVFKVFPFYDQLEQVITSTRRQLRFFGNMKKEEIALNLVDIVGNVRDVLERIVSRTIDPSVLNRVNERYGSYIFKCPRFSCHFFPTGVSSVAERDKHISQHERPFRCSEEKCVGYTFGFASAAEREKHVRENHVTTAIQDEEFPTDQDVERRIMDNHPVADQNPDLEISCQEESMVNSTGVAMEQSESEPESQLELPQVRRQKRPRQTEFECPHCSNLYKKRYNLESHLQTHETQRSHVCDRCNKTFSRLDDYRRHLNTHTGAKNFVCRGELENGNPWGCGKSFARADTLKKHHESRVGRACIQHLQQQF